MLLKIVKIIQCKKLIITQSILFVLSYKFYYYKWYSLLYKITNMHFVNGVMFNYKISSVFYKNNLSQIMMLISCVIFCHQLYI